MTETTLTNQKDNPKVTGFLLIGLGIAFLIMQFVDLGSLFLFLPAIAFMVAGIVKREQGLMIPGGIIGGIGLGAFLIDQNWLATFDEGAVFMFAFALGWVSITVVSALFAKETATWALIPAIIMVFIGLAAANVSLFETTLSFLGQYWPVILIIIGVSVLIKSVTSQKEDIAV